MSLSFKDTIKKILYRNSVILEPLDWEKRRNSGDQVLDSFFTAFSWDIVNEVFKFYWDCLNINSISSEKHILFVVNGHSQLEPLQQYLSKKYNINVSAPDGYADIYAFSSEWALSWNNSIVIILTGPTFIHLLFHGLLSLTKIAIIIFDDITNAHRDHPYCMAMRHFYTHLRYKDLCALESKRNFVNNGVSIFADIDDIEKRRYFIDIHSPHILAFAIHPGLNHTLISSDIVEKKRWILRLQNWKRDFHATIFSDIEPLNDFMSENSFSKSHHSILSNSLLFLDSRVKFVKSIDQSKNFENVIVFKLSQTTQLDELTEHFDENLDNIAFINYSVHIFWDFEVLPHSDLYEFCEVKCSFLIDWALVRGSKMIFVIGCPFTTIAKLLFIQLSWNFLDRVYQIQQNHDNETSFSGDFIESVEEDEYLNLDVSKKKISTDHLITDASVGRSYFKISKCKQVWNDTFGELDRLIRFPKKLLHEQNLGLSTAISETGALLNIDISIDILLRFCSSIPRLPSIHMCRVKIKTICIRVEDSNLHTSTITCSKTLKYCTFIRLPTILRVRFPSIPGYFTGSIENSKSFSQKTASMSVLKTLKSLGLLNNYLIMDHSLREWLYSLTSSLDKQENQFDSFVSIINTYPEIFKHPFIEPEYNHILDDVDSGSAEQIETIIENLQSNSTPFIFNPEWHMIHKERVLYTYHIKCSLLTSSSMATEQAELGAKGLRSGQKHLLKDSILAHANLKSFPVWLAPLTQIIVAASTTSDASHSSIPFFEDSRWGLAWPTPLPSSDLIPCYVPLGTDLVIKMSLVDAGKTSLTLTQYTQLLHAQIIFYATFNLRPMQLNLLNNESNTYNKIKTDYISNYHVDQIFNLDNQSERVEKDLINEIRDFSYLDQDKEELWNKSLPKRFHLLYLLIPLKSKLQEQTNQKIEELCHRRLPVDLTRLWSNFKKFVEQVRIYGSKAACISIPSIDSELSRSNENLQNDDYEPDWDLVHDCLSLHDPRYASVKTKKIIPTTVLELLQLITKFLDESIDENERNIAIYLPSYTISNVDGSSIHKNKLLTSSNFTENNDKIDFTTFVLRTLLIYTPYNSLFYRIKNLRTDISPSTPFKLKNQDLKITDSSCTRISSEDYISYGQYIGEKYNIKLDSNRDNCKNFTQSSNWNQPMIEVRKVENWTDLVTWIVVVRDPFENSLLPNSNVNEYEQKPEFNVDQSGNIKDKLAPQRKRRYTPSASAKRRREMQNTNTLLDTLDPFASQSTNQNLLIPSLCYISPLSYAQIRQAMLIPRFIFDLDRQCYLLEYFEGTIIQSVFNQSENNITLNTSNQRQFFYKSNSHNVIRALTSPTAAFPYDYERLEIFGDSFLKYMTTIDVYTKYPTFTEGRLSSARQTIISNTNLSRIGKNLLKIDQHASLTPFSPKLWTTPSILSLIENLQKDPLLDNFALDSNQICLIHHPHSLTDSYPFVNQIDVNRWVNELTDQLFEPWFKYRRITDVIYRSNKKSKVYKWDPTKQNISLELNSDPTSNIPKKFLKLGQIIPTKSISDIVEAILACIYLDQGHDYAISWMKAIGLISSDFDSRLSSFDALTILGLGVDGVGISSKYYSKIIFENAAQNSKNISVDQRHELFGSHPPAIGIENAWMKERRLGGRSRFCDAESMLASRHGKMDFISIQDQPALQVYTGLLHEKKFSSVTYPPHRPSESEFPFEKVQCLLDYKFKNPRLLFIACTHVSIDPVICNERLEWLGDAAIDWLVTRYLWHEYPHLTPAALTEYRQLIVNNNSFAKAAVLLGLHPYLRIDAPFLQQEIESFSKVVLAQTNNGAIFSNNQLHDAPKAIGDLLEAIAGAVFIDCSFSDSIFLQIWTPLLKRVGLISSVQHSLNVGSDLPSLLNIKSDSSIDKNPIRTVLYTLGRLGIPREGISFKYTDLINESIEKSIVNRPVSQSLCTLNIREKPIAKAIANTRAAAKREVARNALTWIREGENWRQFL